MKSNHLFPFQESCFHIRKARNIRIVFLFFLFVSLFAAFISCDAKKPTLGRTEIRIKLRAYHRDKLEFFGSKMFDRMPFIISLGEGDSNIFVWITLRKFIKEGFITKEEKELNVKYSLAEKGDEFYRPGKGFRYGKSRFIRVIKFSEPSDHKIPMVHVDYAVQYYNLEDWYVKMSQSPIFFGVNEDFLYKAECVFEYRDRIWVLRE